MSTKPPVIPFVESQPQTPRPLDGVRVIDFTRMVAGPFATQILGDLGAEVIKIEEPASGDDIRLVAPTPELGGESSFFLSMNRSKQSVAVDLKNPAGLEVILDLIGTADVLVENFKGSVMRRFGLDYASLRERFPRLIYCSASGYGRSGKNADAGGLDTPLSAEAGVLSFNAYEGDTPVAGAITYTDLTTALNSTIGILAALRARDVHGLGQHVDVAMFDSALANLSFQGAEFLVSGREPAKPVMQQSLPRGLFETADGMVSITCGSDRMFKALCLDVVGRPDWLENPQFATTAARVKSGETFLAEFRPVMKTQASAVWSERCKRAGIPAGILRTTGEALLSEEAMERGQVFAIPHPTAGRSPVIAQPFRLSETPCRYAPAPVLGQHTDAVLSGLLGYSAERVAKLAADGAIRLMAKDAVEA